MEDVLRQIFDCIITGRKDEVEAKVQEVLGANIEPKRILEEGMIAAMDEVGKRFERGVLYVPEMLISAKTMQAGMAVLKPHLVEKGVEPIGKVVIGTVAGDMHSIGKNLVAMMLEGAGFEVIDLGVDVAPDKFASMASEIGAKIIAMSALLTTTMMRMATTIEILEDLGIRDQIITLVGGAPVTEAFAREISADGYAPDASRAVNLAKELALSHQ